MNWELQPQSQKSVRWIEFQSDSESWDLRFLYTQQFTKLNNKISERDGRASAKAEKDGKLMQQWPADSRANAGSQSKYFSYLQ